MKKKLNAYQGKLSPLQIAEGCKARAEDRVKTCPPKLHRYRTVELVGDTRRCGYYGGAGGVAQTERYTLFSIKVGAGEPLEFAKLPVANCAYFRRSRRGWNKCRVLKLAGDA